MELDSAHPEMAKPILTLADIFVARKILSSEYQLYTPQGHFLRAPAVKFFVRLDLDQICLFLDGHFLHIIGVGGSKTP
jgi:hypothetical protein